MDDKALTRILRDRAGTPDENARKEAVNRALAAFDEAGRKSNKISQGMPFWGRLTGRNNLNARRDGMNRKYIYGGMATALALVMAAGISLQMAREDVAVMTATVQESEVQELAVAQEPQERWRRIQEDRSGSGRKAAVMQADEGAVTDYNVAAAPPVAEMHGAPAGAAVMMAAPASRMAAMEQGVASYMPIMPEPMPPYYQEAGRDRFEGVEVSPVKVVATEPVSTFSIDVDTASYSVMRRMINSGTLPPADAVRVEELINYFDYDYAAPADKDTAFAPRVTVVPSPWAAGRKLVHIAIKGHDIVPDERPRSNLVFLIDVSGSMNAPDKLPLLKASFKMLLDTLGPEDTVAIVTYAGHAGTVIEPTRVAEKAKIVAAIDNLTPGGGTAGAAGIEEAYRLAGQNFDKDGVNRVILATDGDFNIGRSGVEDLKTLIESKRKSGVYLSVLGFGMGNLNDHMMQTLAQNGNGTAAYIDTLNEARKVLVEEASSTLFPIAQDVKIQVEFNPATVAEYRLIGYETRALRREDFNNDAVDAGDIGSGHTVTAIYEITPVGGPALVDPSRYAAAPQEVIEDKAQFVEEYGFLKLRYKPPGEDTSRLITTPIDRSRETAEAGHDVEWAIAVAGFGQLLKGGQYMTGFGYDDVITLAQKAKGEDTFGYRAEFLNLARLAKTLAGE